MLRFQIELYHLQSSLLDLKKKTNKLHRTKAFNLQQIQIQCAYLKSIYSIDLLHRIQLMKWQRLVPSKAYHIAQCHHLTPRSVRSLQLNHFDSIQTFHNCLVKIHWYTKSRSFRSICVDFSMELIQKSCKENTQTNCYEMKDRTRMEQMRHLHLPLAGKFFPCPIIFVVG